MVRAGDVGQVLLGSDTGGLRHVVELAGAGERATAVEDDAGALGAENAGELGVEPEVVTNLQADGPEARVEDGQLSAVGERDSLGHPRE